MQIEDRPISSIRPYANNPRLNEQAVDAVATSLRTFGFRQPIVVDEHGTIIVGHTRYQAALQLGLETVPVHVATGLTPAQVKAYRLADNQTATLARWDDDRLALELAELQQMDFDVQATGFSAEDLLRLLEPAVRAGLTDVDEVPEPPDEATTQPGDLWLLGEHRLLCGDSGQPQDVDRLLAGARVQLVHTDPPYNVGVEPRSHPAIAAGLSSFAVTRPPASLDPAGQPAKAHKLRAKDRPLVNDFVPEQEFSRLLQAWFGNLARVLEPGRAFYIWGGYSNCATYPPALQVAGLYFSQAIIWVKEHPVLTRKDFMGNHEWCFYGWREGAGHVFFGPANAVDVWSVKKVNPQSMVHLTEKPVELATRALEYSSRPGEHLLDLFGGSGSTLIAAEQTRRRAFVMELDPLYCDVIVLRWQQFTGKQAQRERPAMVARSWQRVRIGGCGRNRAMPQTGRRNVDHNLLTALACGATVEAAARSAGVSESTVYRRLRQPAFHQRLQEVRADMVQRTSAMLTASGMEAVKTLLALQQASTPASVRLGAARAVLEIGLKVREVADLERRLSALEQHLSSANPG